MFLTGPQPSIVEAGQELESDRLQSLLEDAEFAYLSPRSLDSNERKGRFDSIKFSRWPILLSCVGMGGGLRALIDPLHPVPPTFST